MFSRGKKLVILNEGNISFLQTNNFILLMYEIKYSIVIFYYTNIVLYKYTDIYYTSIVLYIILTISIVSKNCKIFCPQMEKS